MRRLISVTMSKNSKTLYFLAGMDNGQYAVISINDKGWPAELSAEQKIKICQTREKTILISGKTTRILANGILF